MVHSLSKNEHSYQGQQRCLALSHDSRHIVTVWFENAYRYRDLVQNKYKLPQKFGLYVRWVKNRGYQSYSKR